MKRDDSLWKGILENVFDDFLRFFFRDADTLFDFDKDFQFLDKELEQIYPVDESESPKFVDKLVKVFTKNGKEEWILVHIEVQGYNDKDFAKRMFTYFYRILDKYGKMVTAVAIFSDGNKNFRPNLFEYEYLGTTNRFQFNTYKNIDQDEGLLSKNNNPFAIVILTVLLALKKKKLDDEGLYDLKYSLAKNLLAQKIPKQKIRDLLIFLKFYVRLANPSLNAKFDNAIDVLTNNTTTMGIEEMIIERVKKQLYKEVAKEVTKEITEEVTKEVTREVTREVTKEVTREVTKEVTELNASKVVKNLLNANKFTIAEIANFANVSERFVLKVKKGL